MGVHAQGEGRVTVTEILGKLLDRDAPGEHHAGVVVTELVDPFPAGGDVAAAATPVCSGFAKRWRYRRASRSPSTLILFAHHVQPGRFG